MIFSTFRAILAKQGLRDGAQLSMTATPVTDNMIEFGDMVQLTSAGQQVTAETSRNVATAYRCINVLSDDVAKLPLQTFMSTAPRQIERVRPSNRIQNIAWLLEVSPNRWMTPFIFKKLWISSLLWWGNAYIWQPTGAYPELFLLDPAETYPEFDADGNLWYMTKFPNGNEDHIPWVEVNHLQINSKNGMVGRSVLTYAKETVGRQQGAHNTQNMIFANGLNAAAYMMFDQELTPEARQRARLEYQKAISGQDNAGRLAVLDSHVTKFETINIKPVDAQFLETVNATDAQIANYFGIPLYKLNQGKQSYESNEQQNMDYLRSTLNPYLVQIEQGARLKWLPTKAQGKTYFRFNRDSLLQTDAKTRAEVLEKLIFAGILTPNQGLQINDMSPYDGGDVHYVPLNMRVVEHSGGDSMGSGKEEE